MSKSGFDVPRDGCPWSESPSHSDLESEPADFNESDSGSEEWSERDSIANVIDDESKPEECEIEDASVSATATILGRWLATFLLFQSAFWLSNAAILSLFGFMTTFLCVFNELCKEVAKAFPRTLYSAKQKFCTKMTFRRYVVCQKRQNILSS